MKLFYFVCHMIFSFSLIYTADNFDTKKLSLKYIFPEITKKFNVAENNLKKNICEFIFNTLQSPITENIFVTAYIMKKKYYAILSKKQKSVLPIIENFLDIIIPETNNEKEIIINIVDIQSDIPKPNFPKPKL